MKEQSMNNFNELHLSNEMKQAIDKVGYTQPTEIQSKAIPLMLQGSDVIGLSETGSGKTAAFSIPALEQMDTDSTVPQLMVIAPTRELAMQIAVEIEKLSQFKKGISVATIFGGDSMPRQIKALKRANIVVGTPGRIQDHIRRRTLILKHLKFVVLDEADEMLNMGFYDDIVNILSKTPDHKQMALFSATMPKEILQLSNDFLKNPETINIKRKSKSPSQIEQYFYYINMRQKKEALLVLLQYYAPERVIVFTNTKRMADELSSLLRSKNISANALHGDMPQNTRTAVLKEFRDGLLNILVATDVAARGIDVDGIDLVVNYDLPQTNEYYIHRIGRTGRAGKDGTSITLASTRNQLQQIAQIKKITKSEITERALPSKKDIEKHILQNKSKDIMDSIGEEIHPLAIDLVDDLIEQSKHQLNDVGLSYVLANKMVQDLLENYDLEEIDKLAKPKNTNRGDQNVGVKVSLGRKDHLKPKNLAGAIIKTLNVKPKDVGDIKLYKNYSLVMMDRFNAEKLVGKSKLRVGKDMAHFEYFNTNRA